MGIALRRHMKGVHHMINMNSYEALSILKELDSELHAELCEHITRVKIFNGSIKGVTSPAVFGALYLRNPDTDDDMVANMLEHLVHEASHLHLHALMALDPIVLNSATEGYRAP